MLTLENFPDLKEEYKDGFEMKRFKFRRVLNEKMEIIHSVGERIEGLKKNLIEKQETMIKIRE